MNRQRQTRSRLRISDQDALLKWCRSNGFSLLPREDGSALAFDICSRRSASESNAPTRQFVLTAEDHNFTVDDLSGRAIARSTQLREVLKQLAAHLAGLHSQAS